MRFFYHCNAFAAFLLLRDALKDIQTKLGTIANKNTIRQEIYLVNDLKFHFGEYSDTVITYYFKNLWTINGEMLPSFIDTPIVIPVSNSGYQFYLGKVTPSYFQVVNFTNYTSYSSHDITFTAMISVIHKQD